MSAKQRPVDSGRRDSFGRVIRVSGESAESRADAPAPPAAASVDDGRYTPPDNTIPDGMTVKNLVEFRRSHAAMDVDREQQPHEVIPVRVGDLVVWDSPATGPSYATVLAARMEKQVTGHDGVGVTWGFTGNVEWAVQTDDGQVGWQRFDQRSWRNLSAEGRDVEGAAPPREVPTSSYMSDSKTLGSAFWRPMEPGRAEGLGYHVDGFQVVETPNGGCRFIKDSGRSLPANRQRPKVAVYEAFEVETYAGEVDGRPTVLARPGSPVGEMFVPADQTARSE